MIFNLTKHYVPEVYSDSRDFRVFLRMIEVLSTVTKYNADHYPDLYDPSDCPDNLLENLASLVGYKDYDIGLKLNENRIIIKYFPYLIRNRGSELGIKLASALSLNTYGDPDEIFTLDNLYIDFDYEKGIIYVYYPKESAIRKSLIEVVRPVGMTVQMVPADTVEANDELDIEAKLRFYEWSKRHNTLKNSQVGFSFVGKNENQEDGLDE